MSLSQLVNPLCRNELGATVPIPMPKLSEQVRLKIREEMARLEMSQRDVAELLGWSQSRVAHLLNGRVEMSVDDLAEFAFILTIRPTEIIRDHGLEFCAEMTPTELRFLERLRQLPQTQKDAMMQLFHIESMTRPQERRAAPPTRKKR